MALGNEAFRAARVDLAAETFQQLAEPASPVAKEALFNASLAWLQAGEPEKAAAAAQELKSRGADENMRGDLRLEEALMQAARGDAGATMALQNFLREFPNHARVSEAYVALAELAFHAAPPRWRRRDRIWPAQPRATRTPPPPSARIISISGWRTPRP